MPYQRPNTACKGIYWRQLCTQGFFRHNYCRIWGREGKEGRKEGKKEGWRDVSERGRERKRMRECVCVRERESMWTTTTGEYRYDTLHRANIALSRANKKDRSGNSAFLLVVAPSCSSSLNVNTCKKTAYTGWSCGGTLGSNKRDFFLSRSLLRCSATTANGNELLKQKQQKTHKRHPSNKGGCHNNSCTFFFFSFFLLLQKEKRKNIPR